MDDEWYYHRERVEITVYVQLCNGGNKRDKRGEVVYQKKMF